MLPKEQERTDYRQVREEIRDGDVALFRNAGLVGRVSGDWTHAALCKWLRDEEGNPTTLMLAESREWHGGRMVTLSSQVRKFPGKIDIYRPSCCGALAFEAAEMACRQAGHPYGWYSIWLAAIDRLTIGKLLGIIKPARKFCGKLSSWYTPKQCAQQDVWAFRWTARNRRSTFDLVPHKSDYYCEPTDIATSGSARALFTGLVHKGAV